MGCHLRRCSFCNRWRMYRRADRTRPHPDDLTTEELTENFNRHIARTLEKQAAVSEPAGGKMDLNSGEELRRHRTEPHAAAIGLAEADDGVEDYHLCTKCGSTLYHRSRRRWFERLLKRPKMARCMKCNHRFPYPRGRD
jgi:hypothetical protein